MTTWDEHLARLRRHWHIEGRFSGLGLPLGDSALATVANDSRLRFCLSVPAWADATDAPELWLPLLARPLPALTGETGDYIGGLPRFTAGMSFTVADHRKQFSSLFKPDQLPMAALRVPMTEADTTIQPGADFDGRSGEVVWVEGEAMRIDSVEEAGLEYGVTRGFHGTAVVAHGQGVDVYSRCARLLGNTIEFWAGPADGGQEDMHRLVSGSIASPLKLLEEGTLYEVPVTCDAGQRLSRKSPLTKRQVVLTEPLFPDGTFVGTVSSPVTSGELPEVQGFVLQWTGGQERSPLVYAQTDKGEVVGLDRATNGRLRVTSRDLLGVGGFDAALPAGSSLTQVFFGNSWRHSPVDAGPLEGASALDDGSGFTDSTHVIDLFLTIATSPVNAVDSVFTNPDVKGNWSVLPGYGLGLRAEELDVSGMLALRDQHPDLVMDYALWGNDPRPAHEVLHEMLRAAGIRLHTVDLVRMTMASLPLTSEELPVLDFSNVLADPGEGVGTLKPRVRNVAFARQPLGTVRVLAGPLKRETVLQGRGAQDVTVAMPWVANEAPFVSRLLARVAQLGRDAVELEVAVSPSVFFSLTWGAQCVYDLPKPPSTVDDLPPGQRQAEVLNLRLSQHESDGIVGVLVLRLYPRFLLSSLIGPSMRIETVLGDGAFEVSVQDFSLSSAATNDGGQAQAGDVLALFNSDGTRVGSGVEVFASFSPPIEVTLGGDFSGAATVGRFFGYAPYDEATANDVRALYLFLSSVVGRTPSAVDPTALPYVWGAS